MTIAILLYMLFKIDEAFVDVLYGVDQRGERMGKLTYLRPRRSDVKPVLVLLTSHRLDCFLVCMRCLERFTDFTRLGRVYVVANALSPDHLALT